MGSNLNLEWLCFSKLAKKFSGASASIATDTLSLILPCILVLPCIVLLSATSSCKTAYKKSVGASTEQNIRRIFYTDFESAWQSTLDALKSHTLDVSNREAGFIQTRWKDNTALKNLSESTNTTDLYIKTQFRFKISVAKGFFNGKPTVQVAVIKEQVVQRDVLESIRKVETDGIEERTLLYRIGRIITIRKRIESIEDEKTKAASESLDSP